jgi:hypothetical protein
MQPENPPSSPEARAIRARSWPNPPIRISPGKPGVCASNVGTNWEVDGAILYGRVGITWWIGWVLAQHVHKNGPLSRFPEAAYSLLNNEAATVRSFHGAANH